MESKFDKINMSLDDIIRAGMSDPNLHNKTCARSERGRSRSRDEYHDRSRSRSGVRGQQWRLERDQQQHPHPRSRSRSQDSCRSSYHPSKLSPRYTPYRCRSLPRQTFSASSQEQDSTLHIGLRSGVGVNMRRTRLGFSASSTSVLRPTSSLYQLRIAKKKVEVAKNILNAKHQSYLRQLRQYRREVFGHSFRMPQYRLKNVQEFPDFYVFSDIGDCNMSHQNTARQRIQRRSYPEGTLSVTFENELANYQNHARKVEDGTMPMGFMPPEALSTPAQMIKNGYIIRNPSVGKVINNDGVYKLTKENVTQTVASNLPDSLPVLVSSSHFPQPIYKPNESNMYEKRKIHPANTIQTLNQRFSNYRVVCL